MYIILFLCWALLYVRNIGLVSILLQEVVRDAKKRKSEQLHTFETSFKVPHFTSQPQPQRVFPTSPRTEEYFQTSQKQVVTSADSHVLTKAKSSTGKHFSNSFSNLVIPCTFLVVWFPALD